MAQKSKLWKLSSFYSLNVPFYCWEETRVAIVPRRRRAEERVVDRWSPIGNIWVIESEHEDSSYYGSDSSYELSELTVRLSTSMKQDNNLTN